MKILVATTNAHKYAEIVDLLKQSPGMEFVSLNQMDHPVEAPEETEDNFLDNAILKASYYSRAYHLPVLAEDSGLEVDALNGEPGVHSARWHPGSDEDRTRALLARMEGILPWERTARYRCVLFYAHLNSEILALAAGSCEGRIAEEYLGKGGFGYDPIFELTEASGAPPEWIGKTLGEAPPEVKAAISHRVAACRDILGPIQGAMIHHLMDGDLADSDSF